MDRARRGGDNRFRIIGGRHRGRRLQFPDVADIRPSPDRVRETLFNWLARDVHGARCLDLFAGSGALGLEALSRGAAFVRFVDRSPAALRAITGHLGVLGLAASAETIAVGAEQALADPAGPWDIVFLDPPFADNAWERLCKLLHERRAVHDGSLVYLELPAGAEPRLPADWHVWKRSRAGQVEFRLVQVRRAATDPAAGDRA